MSWWKKRTLARPDEQRSLELLRLIGHTYVDYLADRFGEDPQHWEPDSMRRKYARYGPAAPPPPFRVVQRFTWQSGSSEHAIGLLLERGRSRYLVFRGTVSESEWLRDILLQQGPCPVDAGVGVDTGLVHEGFARIYRSLEPAPANLDLRTGWGGRLYVTGHSLGGALAALVALALHHLKPRLYTFGTPRIGDATFARAMRRFVPHYHRIENYWDPVTDLPRERVRLLLKEYEYAHAGRREVVFALSQSGGGSVAELVQARIDPWTYVMEGGDLDPLFTHQLSAYEHALGKLIEGRD